MRQSGPGPSGWRCTRCRAAWSRCLSGREGTSAGAEICQFDALAGDEDVFRLDISMENSLAMDVLDDSHPGMFIVFQYPRLDRSGWNWPIWLAIEPLESTFSILDWIVAVGTVFFM